MGHQKGRCAGAETKPGLPSEPLPRLLISYSRLSCRYTEEFDEYTLILLFTTNVQVPYPIRFRPPTYAVSTYAVSAYAMCHIMLVMEGRLHKASAGRMTLSQLFNQALVTSWLLFSGSRSLMFKFFNIEILLETRRRCRS